MGSDRERDLVEHRDEQVQECVAEVIVIAEVGLFVGWKDCFGLSANIYKDKFWIQRSVAACRGFE